MENIYQNLSKKKFLIYSSLLSFFTDILLLGHIYQKFSNPHTFQKSFSMVKKLGFFYQGLPSNMEDQLFQLWIRSLITTLLLVIFFHLIIYALWVYEKKIGKSYMKLYSIMGMFGFIVMALTLLRSDPLWAMAFMICAGIHLIILKGHSFYFKKIVER